MRIRVKYRIFWAVLISALAVMPGPVSAQSSPGKHLIDQKVIENIRSFVDTEIVRLSTENQNKKYGAIGEEQIQDMDKQWRAETESKTDQPLISATLSNPLSAYLTRIQAHSVGLYTEMFVMDRNGLNVGQSNISSDYWQGDEPKFQKTFPTGPAAVFVDDPEYDDKLGIWRIQVNLSISDSANKTAIGAITVEMNLSELQRRKALGTI